MIMSGKLEPAGKQLLEIDKEQMGTELYVGMNSEEKPQSLHIRLISNQQ